jgi:3-(3-hydroxy-phenyl)propionate hydroxylase
MRKLNTSVVICGAGPAGLTLAHLLGRQAIGVILLEKLASTVTEPRAIAIDGESLRTLQQIGLYEGFKDELLPGLTAQYVNSEGVQLFEAGSPGLRPYGYSSLNSFDQPKLDSFLARNLENRATVQACFGTTLEHFEQDANGVHVYCKDANGRQLEISAEYLVGCDGGRSTIRSALGIAMHGESNPQPWLVIDTIDHYLDKQMDCRFFCNPERPGMTIRKQHSERRWEWMLMPGEDREALLEDKTIRTIIAPYTDAANVEIYRKRVYDFHAIMAESWQDGRVFLAGDAAHMTPPFAGQGLNSGFRDVTNLFWKLAAVIKGQADRAILESYELERRQHAWELIETALNLGAQIQPIDPQQAAERDALFESLNKDPAALQALQDDMVSSLLARSVDKGLALDTHGDSISGRLLIQPEVINTAGETVLLDDCLGSGFSIIGYNCNPAELLDQETLNLWRGLDATCVAISAAQRPGSGGWVVDKNRELGDWIGADGESVLLVRPDKFCMAAANASDADEKLTAAHKLLFQ